jgi:Fe-S cluster biogenesis protein NfuA
MLEKVQLVIDEIRPQLQMDGGDVELIAVVDGVVKVKLKGACHGCPMSQVTLKMGIERVIKQRIPEVVRVDSIG